MKYIIFVFCLCLNVMLIAQPIPKDEHGNFIYERVIQAEGLSQEEIYDRLKNWILESFKTGDNLIDLDDKEKEKINATSTIFLDNQGTGAYKNVLLNFKFNVYIKEERFKVVINNFVINYTFGNIQARVSTLDEGFKKEFGRTGKNATQKMYTDVNLKMEALLKETQSVVREEKNDDW